MSTLQVYTKIRKHRSGWSLDLLDKNGVERDFQINKNQCDLKRIKTFQELKTLFRMVFETGNFIDKNGIDNLVEFA